MDRMTKGSIKPLGEGITITMVPAEHGSEVRVKGPEKAGTECRR